VVIILRQIVKTNAEMNTSLYGLANSEAAGRVTSTIIVKEMQTRPAMAKMTGTVIAIQDRP
jgi:hypothetical protein